MFFFFFFFVAASYSYFSCLSIFDLFFFLSSGSSFLLTVFPFSIVLSSFCFLPFLASFFLTRPYSFLLVWVTGCPEITHIPAVLEGFSLFPPTTPPSSCFFLSEFFNLFSWFFFIFCFLSYCSYCYSSSSSPPFLPFGHSSCLFAFFLQFLIFSICFSSFACSFLFWFLPSPRPRQSREGEEKKKHKNWNMFLNNHIKNMGITWRK